eukprot:m.1379958 g.1379958  ORF g.1379958 m.1379958 type:complete len:281 (-) comp24968_c0_seq20:1845-2687(-)
MTLPELYKVYPGEVRRLAPFGCFVSIVGFEKDGLLHISQLGNTRVEKVEDVAAVGDRFFVKVTSLGDDPENPKISLSIKTINQSTGVDSDPTNIVAHGDDKGKKDSGRRDRPPIELGAVYNVICTQCGAKGHFAKNCRSLGEKYDLLPEDDEAEATPQLSAIDRAFRAAEKEKKRAARRLEKQAHKMHERTAAASAFSMEAYMAQAATALNDTKKHKKEHKHKKDKKSKKSKHKKDHKKDHKKKKSKSKRADDDDGSSSSDDSAGSPNDRSPKRARHDHR